MIESDTEQTARVEISIVIPCFNEEDNILAMYDRIQNVFNKKGLAGEIIFVDDCSTDATAARIDALASKYSTVKALRHPQNQGIYQAWKTGLQHARGAYVVFIDADLQNLPEDIWRLYREITFTHADVVSGWRNHIKPVKDLRYVTSKILNHILNRAFGMRLRDNKSGFIIAHREVLRDILSFRFTYHHPQTFITVAAHAKHYTIKQIETLFDVRKSGISYLVGTHFLKASYGTLADIIKGFFEFRMLRSYDNSLHILLNTNDTRTSDDEPAVWRRWLLKLYSITFPFHHWMITSQAVMYYRDLRRSQWLPYEKIKEYQENRLRKLIRHVYHHVPFYRDLFDTHGLSVDEIKTIDDLQKLPIIDKNIVRENLYLGLMSDTHDKRNILKVTTSGSTGEPFFTYVERQQLEMRWAATLRSVEWTGYVFGDKQLRLWHKHLGLKKIEVFKELLDAKFTRRSFIPAYEMNDAGLEKFIQMINRYRPVFMDGYAESFNFIARYLKQKQYHGFKPRAIMSSAQTLPDESRKIIEEGFGCKVFDKYGAREFAGGLAYECEYHTGYHSVAECNIIEIVKDGKPVLPGETGEVVITDLTNFSAPLIRYRLGDLAVQLSPHDPCPCGRGLPRIGKIQGRIQSMIVGTNNQFLPGSFFARLFADYEHAIRQFQVLQPEFGRLKFKLVKADLFNTAILDKLIAETRNHLGADLAIDIEFVESVDLGRTGKRQHTLSSLSMSDILQKIK